MPQDLLTNRLVKNVMTWKWWAGFGFNDLRASIVRMFARIVLVFVGFFLGKFGFAQGFHGFLKVFPWCPFYVKRSGSNRAGRGFNDMEHPGYFLLDVATKTADFKFLCFLKGK